MVWLSRRELGDIIKLLLVKLIGLLIANTGVATLVIVIVKIVRDAGLRIGQVGKNGPVPGFEFLRFEARPETIGLRIVVALASAAVRALLDRTTSTLLINEWRRTHWAGKCEKMAMAFFNISSSYGSRLLAVRSARTSAASAGSAGKGAWAAFCQA